MPNNIIQIADDFWNIRGSFKIGGVIDIGTHASLVKRANGKFLFLDSYSLTGPVKRKISELTDNGAAVETILNLHPFHTIHVKRMHEMFPAADLYGTSRHISRNPDLPWKNLQTDDPKLHALFGDDFDFSVPRGVDFISNNENIHFSSVLAYHRASRTIHADDTLMCFRLPMSGAGAVRFHPTLARALEKRAGAAADFRQWAEALIEQWGGAENLCAAHNSALTKKTLKSGKLHGRLAGALRRTQVTLRAHERKFG